MPDSTESFSLPEGFASIRDPVDGNPFPVDDPRHRVWKDATRTAELEIAQINEGANAARRQLRDDEKRTAREAGARTDLGAHFLVAAANIQDCLVSTVLAKFDAWAKRGVHVVWFDQDVELYDRWLVSFANGWIDLFPHTPPGVPRAGVSQFLLDLRDGLGARVRHWMAEARRYRAEQQAPVSPTEPVLPDDSIPFDITAQDYETSEGRKKALKAFLTSCTHTAQAPILQKHIWQALKYKGPRPLQYWLKKAGPPKESRAIDESVRRVLAMPIPDFLDNLRSRRLI